MKANHFFILAAALGMGFLTSCSNDNSKVNRTANNEDPKENAEEHNDAKFTKGAENDAQFLVDAADINLMEVKAGKLAETNGTSKEVRDLGTMMDNAHQKAYDDLVAMAKKKNISVPADLSDKSQKDVNNLSEKRGTEFDKDFCDAMVSGHKDAIDKFEKASKESTDPEIQAWAASMLPALRMHLDHAMAAQEKSKNMSEK